VKRNEIEHALRAAGDIMKETQFIIIGSQSILGKYPDAPEELLLSAEVDMYAKNKPLETDKLESIGVGSDFDNMYGYAIDPVDEGTAILPKGWKGRLVNLTGPGTNGVTGLCLEPHDLFVSKIAAGRDKDFDYCKVMINHNLVGKERVLQLAGTVKNPPEDPDRSKRILNRIERMYIGVDVANNAHVDEEKGFYTGKVTSVSETIVQQDLGRGKMIFHQLAKLDRAPIVGRSYDIQYNNGSAEVLQLQKEKSPDISR
jgi:hypothetical protein